ncbi:MAG: hypothetical protein KF770_06800 [Anaerolineae bacterium]|nr:hypothetical protein [Anaerolineae bacterium]
MNGQVLLSERQITAILLIACGLIFTVGGILYTGRAIWQWPASATAVYLRWERGSVILAILVTAWGLVLLEDLLRAAGDPVIARLGMVTYLIGAVVVIVAETAYLYNRQWVYSQTVLYVILALLAQAAFGLSLLQTRLVPGWAGWTALIWNLFWLIVLPIAARDDMYYPALHHVAPFVIGIALLTSS